MHFTEKFTKKFLVVFCLTQLIFLLGNSVFGQKTVPQWGLFELTLKGPENGNPFIGTEWGAEFTNGERTYRPEGFYDGNGQYKIRFMPNRPGKWTYKTFSNQPALDGKEGDFDCVAPKEGIHGPVSVRDDFHFQYPDGTPFYPFDHLRVAISNFLLPAGNIGDLESFSF